MNAVPSHDAAVERDSRACAAIGRAGTIDFGGIVSSYEIPLLRYVGQLAGREAAEDLVQETFLRLFRHLARRGASSVRKPSVWLFRVAHNLALDARRRKRTRARARLDAARENSHEKDENPGALDKLEKRTACERAVEELQELPERQKHVLLLKVTYDMNLSEIAEVTGMTVGNVGYHLNRGIRELARRLKAAGVV